MDIGEKVLERLATSEKIVIERQPDDKMRVTSGSWDSEKIIFKDQALEGLLEELRRKSSSNWGAGKRPFAAMPSTIARIIKSHSDKTKPELRRSYYESAKAHFDELVRQGDPYAKTLRRASTELSELLGENKSGASGVGGMGESARLIVSLGRRLF